MKKLTLLVILAVFLLIGCKGNSNGQSNPITDVDVRKGIEGLTMEFVKNAPPDRVFEARFKDDELEGGLFPIAISLKNKGAADIKQGFLSLGLERQYIDFTTNDQIRSFEIGGRSIFSLSGDEERITINAQAKRIGSQSETHPSTIFATACYQYKTILDASACIDPDVFGEKLREKSCEVKDLQFENGQGAPIAITKIETRMLPDSLDEKKVRPHFIVHVENKGNGEVVEPNRVEDACKSTSLDYKDFNTIKARAFLSGNQLNCNIGEDTGETTARLREKKVIIRCSMEDGIEGTRDAFTSPLRIELDYGYTSKISKDIIIEKILTH
jgi:hypothetical protein